MSEKNEAVLFAEELAQLVMRFQAFPETGIKVYSRGQMYVVDISLAGQTGSLATEMHCRVTHLNEIACARIEIREEG